MGLCEVNIAMVTMMVVVVTNSIWTSFLSPLFLQSQVLEFQYLQCQSLNIFILDPGVNKLRIVVSRDNVPVLALRQQGAVALGVPHAVPGGPLVLLLTTAQQGVEAVVTLWGCEGGSSEAGAWAPT